MKKRNLFTFILLMSLTVTSSFSPIHGEAKVKEERGNVMAPGSQMAETAASSNVNSGSKHASERPSKAVESESKSSSSNSGSAKSVEKVNSNTSGNKEVEKSANSGPKELSKKNGNGNSSNGLGKMNQAQSPKLLLPPILIPGKDERVLIRFKGQANFDTITESGGKVNRGLRNSSVVSANLTPEALAEIQASSDVVLIEPDVQVRVNSQMVDWELKEVQPNGSSGSLTGKGIKVAIVDTGVSLSHDDLRVSGGASFVDYTSSYDDDHGHGTHVAGILGALDNDKGIRGVAPEASLYSVKVLDQNGVGYLSDILAGIEWAMNQQVDIINLSLGTPTESPILNQVVNEAYQRGILIVASAGNFGTSNEYEDNIEYPAKYDSVVAVGATNESKVRAPFSATGPALEIVAPGVSIQSTYLHNSYVKMSGTSMATPFVAGNAALLKQMDPSLSMSELREKLQVLTIDLGSSGRDGSYGYGLTQSPMESQPEEAVATEPLPFPIVEQDPLIVEKEKERLMRAGRAIENLLRVSETHPGKQTAKTQEIINKLMGLSEKEEADTYEMLASYYEQLGEKQEALTAQKEAVKQDLFNVDRYKTMVKLMGKEADKNIKAFVNGDALDFDVPPLLKDGRTFVPFRAIAESLQAEVGWDQEQNTVTVKKGETEVMLIIGHALAWVNGKETPLDVPAYLLNGRTLVPVRFLSEALGAKVEWEAETRSVLIVE